MSSKTLAVMACDLRLGAIAVTGNTVSCNGSDGTQDVGLPWEISIEISHGRPTSWVPSLPLQLTVFPVTAIAPRRRSHAITANVLDDITALRRARTGRFHRRNCDAYFHSSAIRPMTAKTSTSSNCAAAPTTTRAESPNRWCRRPALPVERLPPETRGHTARASLLRSVV
jgi:hypothetical protein